MSSAAPRPICDQVATVLWQAFEKVQHGGIDPSTAYHWQHIFEGATYDDRVWVRDLLYRLSQMIETKDGRWLFECDSHYSPGDNSLYVSFDITEKTDTLDAAGDMLLDLIV